MRTFGELMAQVVADARARLNELEEPARPPCCACDYGEHENCAEDYENCGCNCREVGR